MHLMINLNGAGDGKTMASLHRWLSHDARLRQYATLTVQPASPVPGEMGAALDVINAVFADAGAAAGVGSLLVAYRAWRETRTRPPALVIEREGVTITVNDGSEREIRQVIAFLLPADEASENRHPEDHGPR